MEQRTLLIVLIAEVLHFKDNYPLFFTAATSTSSDQEQIKGPIEFF